MPSLLKTEGELLKEIKSSSFNKLHKVNDSKVDRMVELIKRSLSEFYEIKRQIYEKH